MKFKDTYLGKPVVVDYAFATDIYEDLDGVEIIYTETGEQIDYDNFDPDEWDRLFYAIRADYLSSLADLSWD